MTLQGVYIPSVIVSRLYLPMTAHHPTQNAREAGEGDAKETNGCVSEALTSSSEWFHSRRRLHLEYLRMPPHSLNSILRRLSPHVTVGFQ